MMEIESEIIDGEGSLGVTGNSIARETSINDSHLLNDIRMGEDSNKSTNEEFEHVNAESTEDDDTSAQNSKDPFENESQMENERNVLETEEIECSNQISVRSISTLSNNIDRTSENVYYCSIRNLETKNNCLMCHFVKTVKYNCSINKEMKYLCTDHCLSKFQATHSVILHEYFPKFYVPELIDANYKFIRQCKQCSTAIKTVPNCSWEAMDFCMEHCLYRYQKRVGKRCAECDKPVTYNQLGKYSFLFGSIVRQFCSSNCLETKKKKIRICSYCQKSIQRTKTVLGNKYFCNEMCKGMFDQLQKPKRPPYLVDPDIRCFVCKIQKPIITEFDYHRQSYYFCSMQCLTVFKFIQNVETPPKKCHTCSKYVLQQYLEKNALYYDNFIHYFCSMTCQYIYIITHRRVVPCIWCKVKKYNFDMIQKNKFLGNTVYTCSLFCLNQLTVSADEILHKKKLCYRCSKEVGVYDLKLANGTVHTFCSNECIAAYQSQNIKNATPLLPPPPPPPIRKIKMLKPKQTLPDKPGPLPVITSVCSLAPNAKSKTRDAPIKKIIIIKHPELPQVRNIAILVKPMQNDCSTQTHIDTNDFQLQTETTESGLNFLPILVPIYIPSPFYMWNAPLPIPKPFPLIIPCPILIPLTKQTADNVMKEVKKEQVKAPTDPFEAELLMMAELVAAEKKEETIEPSSNDDDEEDNDDDGDNDNDHAEESYSPEAVDTTNAFGEDMLQIALKMASDFEETPVDLEGALTANTITPTRQTQQTNEREDTQQIQTAPSTRSTSSSSGSSRGRRGRGRPCKSVQMKRGRRPSAHMNVPPLAPASAPLPPPEPVEKPDAHMCLKFTFGVNAWKQWVTTKNQELERSSRRLKLFKTDLLQLTSDELNYTLCLFVKEVRKPNGSEYAPDTIYYLCLGIQQYLYENGRIDNIFCDTYYDKFTDTLDEICKKFPALYNDSHYIVTRVEEEHLWESKQLGAHSPHVLLTTLMFFNTKHFNLTTVDEHMQLSFSHIMKHWKRSGGSSSSSSQSGMTKQSASRNVLLRFYPPQSALDGNVHKKKVYEQHENEVNPLRCPVKLYEFYLSKCPESVKTRNDVFYLLPERSCVPDSPVWYSTMASDRLALEKMLHRVKMVKEINVALLTH